jgi:hypothetical protein
MKIRGRKSKPEELLESINSLTAALGDGFGANRLVKAAVIASGVAALTAGSTAISSLRRRIEATS